MPTQALPAARLGNGGWRPAHRLSFRGRPASRPGPRLRPSAGGEAARVCGCRSLEDFQQRDGLGSRPLLLRRARLVALAAGGFLLPWIAVLAVALPATAQAQHWGLAWIGLDSAEAAAALVTALLLSRGDRRASLPAAAGGALLLVDAWFDVCTSSPGAEHVLALAEAALVEIPLAIAAWWLAMAVTKESR
ncbi:MAG: hypothetical protein ABSA02_12685 [Trebonia sp.]|jgi:hypothetical protein